LAPASELRNECGGVKSKPFIIGFVVVVLAIAAVSLYFSGTVERASKSLVAVVSPDGKFKAVKLTIARGGVSPFCYDNIVVLLTVYPDDFDENRKAYEVYAAPCGRFFDGTSSPKIEWLSNTSLQITVAPRSPSADAKAVRKKNIDISKSVHVTFVERP
jgi:hypothetical protein